MKDASPTMPSDSLWTSGIGVEMLLFLIGVTLTLALLGIFAFILTRRNDET